MKRPKTGSTPKQYAYAVRRLNGDGGSKKDIALSAGFSPAVAANAHNKIEKSEGYLNAMIELATESNNMVLAIMSEYKARGLQGFSNSELNSAMNAITGAWEKFNKVRAPNGSRDEENPLKKVFMQRIENQTINVAAAEVPAAASIPIIKEEIIKEEIDDDMDF